jgi:hypothetical protein
VSSKGLPENRRNLAVKMLEIAETPAQVILLLNFADLNRKYDEIRTIGDAFHSDKIKLNEISKIYTKETPVLLIETWLNALMVYLNYESEREDYQMNELAKYIYDEMSSMNIVEMTLFFRWVRKGRYGKFFGRIDPVEMLRWVKQYRGERGTYISRLTDDKETAELRRAREEYSRIGLSSMSKIINEVKNDLAREV